MNQHDQDRPANPTAASPRRHWLEWASYLPPGLLALTMLLLHDSPLCRETFEAPWLLLALNLVFLTGSSLLATFLAARGYLSRGDSSVLLLGTGMLVLGLGNAAAGAVRPFASVNAAVTIHNSISLLTGALCLLSAAGELFPLPQNKRSSLLRAFYLMAAAVVGALTISALAQATPVFVDGGGQPTALRQIVLYSAVGAFAVAAILLKLRYYRNHLGFIRYYSLGLGLIALGLLGVSLQNPVGGVLSWLGRASQYLGGLYIVAAVVSVFRREHVWQIPIEAALRERDEQLKKERNLLQAIIDGALNMHLVYLDRDFNFIRVNRTYADGCGYRPEEMVGKNHFALYPHAENEAIFRQVRDSGQAAELQDKPFEFPDQPGRGVTYWDWTLTPVKSHEGHVEGLVLALVETTRRKQAQQALEKSEARFRLLSNVAGELLASEDPQDVVTRLCRAVMNHLDCHVSFNFIMDPSRGRLHLNAFAGIAPEEARKIEWLDLGVAVCGCVARDGCRIVVEEIEQSCDPRVDLVKSYGVRAYACHPLLAGKRVLGTLSFGTRTRDHFRADELALMKTVSDEVAVAMERIQTAQALRQSTEDLKRSNEELEQFAYVASHDLQEPLRMVGGFVKLLEERYQPLLDEKARQYIQFAADGAARMSKLITDLLEYGRVERKGRQPGSVDANGSLAVAQSNLRAQIEEASAVIESENLPTVQADGMQLVQVFQNLLGNAIKFRLPDRPCRVQVGAHREDGQWVFRVQDNGIGIEREHFDRVFQIFQRLHSRTQYEGTGIGLAICKKIVERHGGRMWVKSEVGSGTTFFFSMPAAS